MSSNDVDWFLFKKWSNMTMKKNRSDTIFNERDQNIAIDLSETWKFAYHPLLISHLRKHTLLILSMHGLLYMTLYIQWFSIYFINSSKHYSLLIFIISYQISKSIQLIFYVASLLLPILLLLLLLLLYIFIDHITRFD